MKSKNTWKRMTAMLLAVLVLMGTLVPSAEVHAVSEPSMAPSASTANVPSKGIPVSLGLTAVKMISKVVLAANYASKNSTGDDYFKLFKIHFNGNAQIYEQNLELREEMLELYELTEISLNNLKRDIEELRQSIDDLNKQLENLGDEIKYTIFLHEFFVFFESKYSALETAYSALTNKDPNGDNEKNGVLVSDCSNDATVRSAMDNLYKAAKDLENLGKYITGKINFNGQSILDIYYDYQLKSNNVQPGDSEAYRAISEKCMDFTLQMFSADAFQRYCFAFASNYQLNYVYDHMEEMISKEDFIGYTVESTGEEILLNTIKTNIEKLEISFDDAGKIDGGLDLVSAKVAANIAKIYLANTYMQYSDGAELYVAPVSNNKIYVYSGASYEMTAIPDVYQEIFGKDFSFVVSDASAADVTSTGNVKVTGKNGEKFTVSYVYGKGILEQPITVYSVEFTISDRKWAGGYGTASAPYLISTVAHMKEFASNSAYWASGVHVKLISDLDASGKSLGKVTEYFGTFDGGNHTIKNISSSGGLFGTNKGTIKNLALDKLTLNYSAAGSVSAGGIVDINSGVIENCHLRNSNITVYCHNYKGGNTIYTSFTANVGGIAGSGTGKSVIKGCSVTESTVKAETSTKENSTYVKNGTKTDVTHYTTIYVGGVIGSTNDVLLEQNYVGVTNISAYTYAKYYREIIWLFYPIPKIELGHVYNRVHASIYSGIIAGNQSGSFVNNGYYKSDNSTKKVEKIAKLGAYTDKDDGFVTENKPEGVQGSKLTQAMLPHGITSVSIKQIPNHTFYHINDTVNTSGLKVVDNFNNPVYGYSVVSEGTESNGKKIVTVEYLGHKATFEVEVGCLHKNIAYAEAELNKETLTFYTAGIFCNDCQTYTNGRESTAHESCVDSENDHVCDVCATTVGNHEAASGTHVCAYCKQTVSECSDADKNHKCDVCGKAVGVHEAMEGGHICAYCDNLVTYCVDNDKNHSCDICGVALGTHKAETGSHYCSYCGKALSACVDIDKDEKCDICEKNVQNPPALTYQMGDVNGDGKINSRDALMIKQYVVKMITFTEEQLIYANVYYDVNSDGTPKINSRDAMLLQQFIVKMDVTLGGR